jgi:hypothetical protein
MMDVAILETGEGPVPMRLDDFDLPQVYAAHEIPGEPAAP